MILGRRFTTLCALLAMTPLAGANPAFTDSFSTENLDPAWTVTGAVKIDAAQARDPGGRSLRLGPRSRASLSLRDRDASGSVSLWVYDDLTAPAKSKDRRGGPQWGLLLHDGTVLVVGSLYAPYLSGATTFATAEYNPATDVPWQKVQYLGEKRKPGWHQWVFTMDAEQGLSLAYDSKPVKRFDWNRSDVQGFTGVVLIGDSKVEDAQILWVDDLEVVLGPAMKSKPVPPPPPPPVVPDKDPELEGAAVELVPAVRAQHPRLFFGPDDLDALRIRARSPAMKVYWDDLMAYLPACQPPGHTNFLTDATDGQRQGLWRMPTLAMHYVVTGEPASLNRAVGFMKLLLDLEHWETSKERDAGMSSANIMLGAAICYDWLHDRLEPGFREQFRKKLIAMARAQYHGGHLNKNKSTGYWQGDPANNHRWHRDAGLALAVLTAYEGHADERWILQKTAEELAFVAAWLPEDGSSHESPTYLSFGLPHLTLALQAADRCLGTHYLDLPFSQNVAHFKLQTLAPGFKQGFQYGDSSGVGGYNHPLWLYTAHHRQGDIQAGLKKLDALDPEAFQFGWMALLWQDPALEGDAARVATTSFFPDLGLGFMRDTWNENGVAVMFKCSALGGETLNRYRNGHGFPYVNVAHDDPDANSFMLFAQGAFLAENDRYSGQKRSANHNTILVNGQGQMAKGRKEGAGWSQPATGNTDMRDMGFITGWKDAGDIVIFEGEAGGSYARLDRYRRTFVWVKGAYLLILDDIQAPDEVDVTWLLQAPELAEIEAGKRYELRKGRAACPVILGSDRALTPAIADSTADHRGTRLGWKQLQLNSRGTRWRIVSVFDPWRRGDLELALTWPDAQRAIVTVKGKGMDDTWAWTLAADRRQASSLKGRADLGEPEP